MEKELFFSGYCRTIDASRMVSVELEDDTVTDVGCSFDGCPYAQNCTIAQQIMQFKIES